MVIFQIGRDLLNACLADLLARYILQWCNLRILPSCETRLNTILTVVNDYCYYYSLLGKILHDKILQKNWENVNGNVIQLSLSLLSLSHLLTLSREPNFTTILNNLMGPTL